MSMVIEKLDQGWEGEEDAEGTKAVSQATACSGDDDSSWEGNMTQPWFVNTGQTAWNGGDREYSEKSGQYVTGVAEAGLHWLQEELHLSMSQDLRRLPGTLCLRHHSQATSCRMNFEQNNQTCLGSVLTHETPLPFLPGNQIPPPTCHLTTPPLTNPPSPLSTRHPSLSSKTMTCTWNLGHLV